MLAEHRAWHTIFPCPPCGGGDFLGFHRDITTGYNDFRKFFGYRVIAIRDEYNGSGDFPKKDTDGFTLEEVRASDNAKNPLPSWFTRLNPVG